MVSYAALMRNQIKTYDYFVRDMTTSVYWVRRLIVVIGLLATNFSMSTEPLKEMRWNKRVIITFSNAQSNPDRLSLKNQIDQLRCEFKNRHLVHIDLMKGSDEYEKLSRQYLNSENEFTLLLLGKDGEIKLMTSRPSLVDIFSLIDTMPMRRREMRSEKC